MLEACYAICLGSNDIRVLSKLKFCILQCVMFWVRCSHRHNSTLSISLDVLVSFCVNITWVQSSVTRAPQLRKLFITFPTCKSVGFFLIDDYNGRSHQSRDGSSSGLVFLGSMIKQAEQAMESKPARIILLHLIFLPDSMFLLWAILFILQGGFWSTFYHSHRK